jgi:hypothetical protein
MLGARVRDARISLLVGGEIDPLGERRDALGRFLDEKVAQHFTIETRTDTHAIIAEPVPRFWRRLARGGGRRYVVEVDEHGRVTMSPAEPLRT